MVRWKIKNPDGKWTQRMELNLISDHWHNFDEKTKNLMLMAVPELAAYILRDELQLTDKPVKF